MKLLPNTTTKKTLLQLEQPYLVASYAIGDSAVLIINKYNPTGLEYAEKAMLTQFQGRELMEFAIYRNMPSFKRFLRSLFVIACKLRG